MLTKKPIAIAADHRGFPLKEHVKGWLLANGYQVNDLGVDTAANRVDAMDYALKLAKEIKQGRSDFVIGICGDGQNMAITANRFPFMRAALVSTPEAAIQPRQHNDVNMLSLPGQAVAPDVAEKIVANFLTTEAMGDRYAARREKLTALNIEEI